MGRGNRAVSMNQIAKMAGVSHQTVSRVINGGSGVRPKTRERVEEVIQRTGYIPNTAARTLVTNRSGMIGVVAVGSFLFGPTHTLTTIEQAARKRNYATLLATVKEDSQTEFLRVVNTFLQRSVDVIIVIAARERTWRYAAELDCKTPIVMVGGQAQNVRNMSYVSVDQAQGARLAVRHLNRLGHKKIAVIAGPSNWTDAQLRLAATKDEVGRLGMSATYKYGDWSAQSGFEIGIDLASTIDESGITAAFAANDHMALGMLSAFYKCGVSVPSDVSVVGFDNVPESAYYTPALTTISQDFEQLGVAVLEKALDLLENSKVSHTLVPAVLVVRESTKRRSKQGQK